MIKSLLSAFFNVFKKNCHRLKTDDNTLNVLEISGFQKYLKQL